MSRLIIEEGPKRPVGQTGEYPLFFASGGLPLYGVFHPPNSITDNKRVLVICHAIGTEHMLTQRMEALGARVTASAGFAAFRYNSRGDGDSAGDPRDLTLADLVEDACAAADIARTLSGASRIIWLGVRLGCIVAAEAMRQRNDTGAVAFWEPVHRGADYFRSLLRATFFTQVAKGWRPNGTIDDMLKRVEQDGEAPVVAGYVYGALYQSAYDADLGRSLQNWGGDTLIAQIQRRRKLSEDNERLRSGVNQRGAGEKVTVDLIAQEPPWTMLTVAKPQWTTDKLLIATKEWLNGLE